MIKIYKIDEEYDKIYKDKNGSEWGYFSKKKSKELNSEDKINIIGEVLGKSKNVIGSITIKDRNLAILEYGSSNRFITTTVGYIKCDNEKNQYIAIIKRRYLLIAILTLVVAGILAFSLAFKFNNSGPILDANAKKYVANIERPDDWDPSRISIPGYDVLKSKSGEGAVYVALWNPDENGCYFEFEIIMDDTKDVIYKTGLIAPGQAVTKIPLEKNYTPGEYNITLKINTYSLENHKEVLNGAVVKTKLIVME